MADWNGYIMDISKQFDQGVDDLNQQVEKALEDLATNPSDPKFLAEYQSALAEYTLYRNAQSNVVKAYKDLDSAIIQNSAKLDKDFIMSVSNMPPIDRAEQSAAREIQQAKVIDLNDRVLNLDNPDDKMISAFANYAVQTENWQQNALQALRSDKKGLTPEKLLVLQDHVLNYNVEVSLVGTLARKIVAAVETLTRS